jgi:hypothetical protein
VVGQFETPRSACTSSERIYAVGMNKKQLTRVGAVATIGGGIVTLHGITSRRWQRAHTAFATLALVVAAISFLQSHRRDAPLLAEPTRNV